VPPENQVHVDESARGRFLFRGYGASVKICLLVPPGA
jgi:hypothetical protein